MSALAPVLEALTILIAEDSAADRLLLSTIIRRQGHQVLTASNGAEAVEIFRHERPQLVLMDALMPVMDGFEAARQIKQLAGRRWCRSSSSPPCAKAKRWPNAWMPAATTSCPNLTTPDIGSEDQRHGSPAPPAGHGLATTRPDRQAPRAPDA